MLQDRVLCPFHLGIILCSSRQSHCPFLLEFELIAASWVAVACCDQLMRGGLLILVDADRMNG